MAICITGFKSGIAKKIVRSSGCSVTESSAKSSCPSVFGCETLKSGEP